MSDPIAPNDVRAFGGQDPERPKENPGQKEVAAAMFHGRWVGQDRPEDPQEKPAALAGLKVIPAVRTPPSGYRTGTGRGPRRGR